MQQQARKWIVEEYMYLRFLKEREVKTSVDLQQFSINKTYSKSLKEFLKLKINGKEIAK